MQATHEDMHWVKFLTVNLAGTLVTNATTTDVNAPERSYLERWVFLFSTDPGAPIMTLRVSAMDFESFS